MNGRDEPEHPSATQGAAAAPSHDDDNADDNVPREIVDSPTLVAFKMQLGRVLGHLVPVMLCLERLDRMIPEVFSILVFYDPVAP